MSFIHSRRIGRMIDDEFIRSTLSQFEELTRRTRMRTFHPEFHETYPMPTGGSSIRTQDNFEPDESEVETFFPPVNEPKITKVEEEEEDESLMAAMKQSLLDEEERKLREEKLREEEAALLHRYEEQSLRQKEREDWERKELEQAIEFSRRDQERVERGKQILEERQIREAQDRDFIESLWKDQERDRQLAQAQFREHQQAAKQQEMEEERAAKELSILLGKRKKCQELKESLPKEPPSGSADTTHIAVRLPNGQRIERRFSFNTKLGVLKNWLDSLSLEQDIPETYTIVTSFPIKSINNWNQTFQEMGLVPRALVTIQS